MSDRCDNPLGREELYICNSELVDGGPGVGVYCPLCNLRDKAEDLLDTISRQEIRIHNARTIIEALTRSLDVLATHGPNVAGDERCAAHIWLKASTIEVPR